MGVTRKLKFVDLCAGLGGFHVALRRLGHECVFSCELDPTLRQLYLQNFGIRPAGDIRAIRPRDVPPHDILCAGIPCQPFSKAGDQQGLDCPKWGDLFDQVLRIASHHQPSYLLLENVPNLLRHDSGRTWRELLSRLRSEGYNATSARLSPHEYGIPQQRERLFVVASRLPLPATIWPERSCSEASIRSVLQQNPTDTRRLSRNALVCLDTWQEFLDRYPSDEPFPSFPIWSAEFGATYP